MFKRIPMLVSAVAAALLLFGVSGGLAAVHAAGPPATQQIAFRFTSVNLSSVLGGSTSGEADVAGTIGGDAELSTLRGSLNFPLRDFTLSLNPTGAVQHSSSSYHSYWYEYVNCNPYCTVIYHAYTQVNESWSAPVEMRFGAHHGNGNLSWSSSRCEGDCPPWFYGYGSSSLSGGVTSAQDGGSIYMSGPAPTIQ